MENKHMRLADFKNDYNWQTIFLDEDYPESNLMGGVDAAGNPETREVRKYTMDDVVEILDIKDGERDMEDWVGLFKCKDGTFLYVSASCDYTGWNCRSSCAAEWHTDLDQLRALSCGDRFEK